MNKYFVTMSKYNSLKIKVLTKLKNKKKTVDKRFTNLSVKTLKVVYLKSLKKS